MGADVHGEHALGGDGSLLAVTDVEGGLGLFDVRAGTRIWYVRPDQQGRGAAAALSADGSKLALTSIVDHPDGTVASKLELRDPSTGAAVASLSERPSRRPSRLIFDPQGRRLTLIDYAIESLTWHDYRATTWDLGASARPVVKPGATSPLPQAGYREFAITPDGLGYARTTDDDRPGVYDLATNALRVPLADAPPGLSLNVATFSPNGRRLAVYDRNARTLMIWNAGSGKLLHQAGPFTSQLARVALQPGGEAYVTADEREEVRLIDPSRGLDLQVAPPNPHAKPNGRWVKLAFTSTGTDFLVARLPYMEADRIELRSTADGKLRAESPVRQMGEMGEWTVLDESNGGPAILYSQGRYVWCWRWDQADERDAQTASLGHSDEVWAVAYDRAGSLLVTASNDTHEDQTIKVWDARTFELKRSWKGHNATVTAISLSPDGRRMASSGLSVDQPVRVWDVATGELIATPDWPAEPARSIAFDPRGERLAAVGGDGTVRLWNASNLATIWTADAHIETDDPRPKRVHTVVFSPDSARLATGGDDGLVRIWDAATGARLAEFRGPAQVQAIAFDPEGRRLAAGNNEGAVYLLDPVTAKLERVIRSDDRNIRGLAFSPDGRTLASGGVGKSIRLWDPETGHELLTLEGHKAQINALAFSPDGSTLTSADHSGAVLTSRTTPSRPSDPWPLFE